MNVSNPPRNGHLWHFTQDVLSGRVQASMWHMLYIEFFKTDPPEESWTLLRQWSEAHGIRWMTEYRWVGKEHQPWVRFSVPPKRAAAERP
jgi:hypothetical protein